MYVFSLIVPFCSNLWNVSHVPWLGNMRLTESQQPYAETFSPPVLFLFHKCTCFTTQTLCCYEWQWSVWEISGRRDGSSVWLHVRYWGAEQWKITTVHTGTHTGEYTYTMPAHWLGFWVHCTHTNPCHWQVKHWRRVISWLCHRMGMLAI